MGCLFELLFTEIAGGCLQALIVFIWRVFLFIIHLIIWPFEYVFRLATKDEPPEPPWSVFFPEERLP